MEKFTLAFLQETFSQSMPNEIRDMPIHEVYSNSRKEVNHGLFIPLIGERFDGHNFIKDAYENGAVAAFWARDERPEDIPDDFPLILVDDTLSALQQLAKAYRKKVQPKVIGVTGSNGKTTTKELISKVAELSFKTAKTEGNLNNHIGLPLTVLQMPADTEVLVAEMGMSAFGEIELLTKIIEPDIAVITNIGESHIEFLGSREGIARAKLEITHGLKENGYLIVDGDEPLLSEPNHKNIIRCGFARDNDYQVQSYDQLKEHSEVTINGHTFTLPLLGKHQALNASFALAVANVLDISINEATKQLESVHLPGMRFEQIETKQGALLINDAYNASATSMIASLEVLKHMEGSQKIAVLADIFELGDRKKEIHRTVGQAIGSDLSHVFTYGEDSRYILESLPAEFKGESKHFTSKEKLIKAVQPYLKKDTVILFKGSRGMKLEEVVYELIED